MKTNVHFQPRDRSLQAFREWFEGKYPLQANARKTMRTQPWVTEQEWTDHWKRYWAKMDGTKPKGK